MAKWAVGGTLGVVGVLGLAGCQKVAAQAPETGEAKSRVPDNADTVAQQAVDGRVTVTLHVDRLQGFRFSKRLVLLGGWEEALTGTGVDALTDVRRTFIAAHASHNGDVAIVLQHTAPEEKVAAAIRGMQKKWVDAHRPLTAEELDASVDGGGRIGIDEYRDGLLLDLAEVPFPAAYRRMKNDFAHIDGPVLVAAPHPGLIAVLPAYLAYAAEKLVTAGGLPGPSNEEAMVFRAWEPDASIQGGPVWSHDVRYAEAVFTFDAWGNSNLRFRAVCTSAEAARAQAERMTGQVEDAQSVSIGGARLRLFDYIEFHAERERVQMTTRLFADDVDWIVAMSMKPL